MERIIVMDEKYLDALKTEIADAVVKALQAENVPIPFAQNLSEWIDPEEAKQILGYRSKTKMQELRISGSIIYAKYGRKIRYNRQSLLDFLERNKNPFQINKRHL